MNWISAPRAPPIDCLQHHHLHVLLQSRSIIACKCITKLIWTRRPSESLSSLDVGFPVQFLTCSITASQCITKYSQSWSSISYPNSLDYGLQLPHLVNNISACKWIFKLARSRPPIASPNWLDLSLQKLLWVRLIAASKCIYQSRRSLCSGAPRIAPKHRLLTVQIYHVSMGSYIGTWIHRRE